MNAIQSLSAIISRGLPDKVERGAIDEETAASIEGIFGERYHSKSPYRKRVVFAPGEDSIPFSGLLHHDSPNSGPYGGMSLIWFPCGSDDDDSPAASLLTLVCGTRGLSPDEAILGRPGHARHVRALQRYLREKAGIVSWVKQDPADLSAPFPRAIKKDFSQFDSIIKKYGSHIYFAVVVPKDLSKAQLVVSALLDLYAYERRWKAFKEYESEIHEFRLDLHATMFPKVDQADLVELLKERRFVILQGPPGTGKTRMAEHILKENFSARGFSVQFHPAVSYESFVAGISPRVDGDQLNFRVKPGWILDAVRKTDGKPFLLHIDEINRADLSRVLGESIYLFEAREIAEGRSRQVRLSNPIDSGEETLQIPNTLFVLGTMNSADRSIAIMDMAVRRRFAFVDVWPDIDVIRNQGLPLATEAFSRLQGIFIEFATDEAFALLPGHSYFLANGDGELKRRMKFDLIPLLNEYLLEGRLASCESELRAFIDWLGSEV